MSKFQFFRIDYLARIAEVDSMLGQVLDTLESTGRWADTMVVYLSDHGDLHLEHGQYLKNALFEGSVRVPFIVKHPEGKEGQRIDTPVSLIDVFPTFLEAFQCPPSADAQGRSLLPSLRGAPTQEAPIFAEYHSNFQPASSYLMMEEHWKLMVFHRQSPLLFDTRSDPDEQHDRSAEHPGVVAALLEKLQGICPVEDVSQRAMEEDRLQLQEWMQSPLETWRDRFIEHFPDAKAKDLDQLESWANPKAP